VARPSTSQCLGFGDIGNDFWWRINRHRSKVSANAQDDLKISFLLHKEISSTWLKGKAELRPKGLPAGGEANPRGTPHSLDHSASQYPPPRTLTVTMPFLRALTTLYDHRDHPPPRMQWPELVNNMQHGRSMGESANSLSRAP
jgi:hypothetical protein